MENTAPSKKFSMYNEHTLHTNSSMIVTLATLIVFTNCNWQYWISTKIAKSKFAFH